ncbi:MAG: hypothetical protein RL261_2439 [Pseudomonadota bacterium]
MNRRIQSGVTTVEFAIVGLVLLTTLFAIIEFGRIVFTYNVLQEGARRAARVAAVCAVNDPAIATTAILLPLPNLTTDNVETAYLDANGAVLAAPGTTDYGQITFVRVRIVDYSFEVIIPLVPQFLNARQFSSTLPRESLGVAYEGASPAC